MNSFAGGGGIKASLIVELKLLEHCLKITLTVSLDQTTVLTIYT